MNTRICRSAGASKFYYARSGASASCYARNVLFVLVFSVLCSPFQVFLSAQFACLNSVHTISGVFVCTVCILVFCAVHFKLFCLHSLHSCILCSPFQAFLSAQFAFLNSVQSISSFSVCTVCILEFCAVCFKRFCLHSLHS